MAAKYNIEDVVVRTSQTWVCGDVVMTKGDIQHMISALYRPIRIIGCSLFLEDEDKERLRILSSIVATLFFGDETSLSEFSLWVSIVGVFGEVGFIGEAGLLARLMIADLNGEGVGEVEDTVLGLVSPDAIVLLYLEEYGET